MAVGVAVPVAVGVRALVDVPVAVAVGVTVAVAVGVLVVVAVNTLFRPFAIPKPYRSLKDVFCIVEQRTTDGYGKVSFRGEHIHVPNVPLREEVKLHLTADKAKQALEIRIWWNDRLAQVATYPLGRFPRVHF